MSFTEARLQYSFRCIITNAQGLSVTSDAVKLEKLPVPVIVTQPENFVGQIGDSASFTVEATGDGLSYQWQYLTPSGKWVNSGMTGSKTATLKMSFTEARLQYSFRCVITNAQGLSVTTNAVKLEKLPAPVIVTQPENFVGQIGDNASFTVEASGDGLTYQWQYLTPSGKWVNSGMTGNKTATLKMSFTEARLQYSFRCIITNEQGLSVTSASVRLISE